MTQDESNSSIKLTKAPDIHFAEQKITGSAQKALPADSIDAMLEVVNPGLISGWNVVVNASPFTSADGKQTLTGAQLSLANGSISSDTDVTDGVSQHDLTPLGTDDALIFDAAASKGIGTWDLTHDKSNATLDIPSGAVAGDYASTLTWTLVNAPSGQE